MISFTQSVVRIVRNIRASEQDALLSHRENKIIIANYCYDDVRKQVLKRDPSIVKDTKKYGVYRKISGCGFVLHHFNWQPKKKQIHQGIKDYSESRKVIAKIRNGELDEQIAHLVLIPAWFHNYIHSSQSNGKYLALTRRQDFYTAINDCIQNNISDIKELEFKRTSIPIAVKSIEKISLVAQNKKKQQILDILENAYDQIIKKIKKDSSTK